MESFKRCVRILKRLVERSREIGYVSKLGFQGGLVFDILYFYIEIKIEIIVKIKEEEEGKKMKNKTRQVNRQNLHCSS